MFVQLDLKGEQFTPGKKNYERVQQCLKENFQLKMNCLIAWDPPEEKICPSSVAAYLSSRGYKVSLCEPVFSKQVSYNVKFPEYPQDTDDSSILELMEWLGGFSIGAELEPDESDSFVNAYTCPLQTTEFGAVTHIKWTGYFTFTQIHNLFEHLRAKRRSWLLAAECLLCGGSYRPLAGRGIGGCETMASQTRR
ncbi:hypothetical protein C0J52_00533 [Blattella germanica]|nr:hypothetical protein C0J52_00533 [Blattella germanica]